MKKLTALFLVLVILMQGCASRPATEESGMSGVPSEPSKPSETWQNPSQGGGTEASSGDYNSWANFSYMMLYGKWEITGIIAYNDRYTDYLERYADQDLTGTRVEFLELCYIFDGVTYFYPKYDFYILPLYSSDDVYHRDRAYWSPMPYVDEIGVTGNYYVMFKVRFPSLSGISRYSSHPLDELVIVIVDDDTMVLEGAETYHEMKRISHTVAEDWVPGGP